ncbi:DUF2515 family protein [Neolewinella antarctica]|uniref:Uncharacterized protein n=1 Tax=Neolewinella antarctica TaxID=442734 RepID=A0ABX0XEV7_9BACT|nr:hypothetical protein [Neolewinella antarctica]NJC27419.1 hypothetical protein [Neolewinella antarctica]
MDKYSFSLPPEEQVIKRNRTITTYYAQLYQNEPQLYKWAGMAAFASFHVGEKMKRWNWEAEGIKPLSFTCEKRNRTIEDDFQIIRIINNRIFSEIGWVHLAFGQMDFQSFRALLLEKGRHPMIVRAFEKLDGARMRLRSGERSGSINELVWEANTEILWHEQSEVVQPLFDQLSELFSHAMTFFASFDYKINHHGTTRNTRSRFVLYMLFNGFRSMRKGWMVPKVTNLQHRWCWISNSLLNNWILVESDRQLIATEIKFLAELEQRNLRFQNSL